MSTQKTKNNVFDIKTKKPLKKLPKGRNKGFKNLKTFKTFEKLNHQGKVKGFCFSYIFEDETGADRVDYLIGAQHGEAKHYFLIYLFNKHLNELITQEVFDMV